MSRCCFGDVSAMSRSCLCLFLLMSPCCFGLRVVLVWFRWFFGGVLGMFQ